jgi:uracil-DNA glycosylase
LLGNTAVPGEDYVFAEVVHCKSTKQLGVSQAATKCRDLWLERVLVATEAKVIVVIGAPARDAFRNRFSVPLTKWEPVEVTVAGSSRLAVAVPHSNAWNESRKWREQLSARAVSRLRK